MCSLIYKEVIGNYLTNDSNMYSFLLDATKAFDRLHFGRLFSNLLKRKMPIKTSIILLSIVLFDSYTRQNDISIPLKYQCIGCHINKGALAYADDIT